MVMKSAEILMHGFRPQRKGKNVPERNHSEIEAKYKLVNKSLYNKNDKVSI